MSTSEIICVFGSCGSRSEVAGQLRRLAERIDREERWEGEGLVRPLHGDGNSGEEFLGRERYFGVFEDGEAPYPPQAMFKSEEVAAGYAAMLRHADLAICRVDVVGSVWNHVGEDPWR